MARKSLYYTPKMFFLLTESSFADQSTIWYYHFCSNIGNQHEIHPRNEREVQASADTVETVLGSHTRKPSKTNDLLRNASISIEREIGKLLLSHLKKYLLQVTNSCPQSSEICATESIKHLNQGSSAFSFWVFFLTIKVQRMIEKREEKKSQNS